MYFLNRKNCFWHRSFLYDFISYTAKSNLNFLGFRSFMIFKHFTFIYCVCRDDAWCLWLSDLVESWDILLDSFDGFYFTTNEANLKWHASCILLNKNYQLGNINKRNFIQVPEGRNPRIMILADFVFIEGSLGSVLFLCVSMVNNSRQLSFTGTLTSFIKTPASWVNCSLKVQFTNIMPLRCFQCVNF